MNTNIRTVSVHDTLFGRVANNLEVGLLPTGGGRARWT